MTHTVFVYGTLKNGEGNNHLLDDSAFIGAAVTDTAEYSMLDGGFPVVLPAETGGLAVAGEIWEVDDQTLVRLDRLEGYRGEGNPTNMYDRKVISVKINGQRMDNVSIYIGAGRWQERGVRHDTDRLVNAAGNLSWTWRW